ncbi:nitroreductase [Desulfosarcina variabilis str. Montpellier]|uniref:nitroreductase family protein n=1 Tax=Desulfosarcina variabilis TaxID=2300 RepID=UPI003AFACA96
MDNKPTFEELKPMLRPTGIIQGVISVDPEKCTSCGLCIINCPFDCLEMDEQKHPQMKADYTCMSCSNCLVACEANALSVERTFDIKSGFFDTNTPESTPPIDPRNENGQPDEWNPTERVILERRSVRNFKKKPVPETLLQRILEAGRFAPSGGNHQPWKFTVVTDPEFIAELETTCHGFWAETYPVFTNDDTVMNMVGMVPTGVFDPRTQRGVRCIALKKLSIYFGCAAIIFMGANTKANDPEVSIGICGQNMNLAAQSLGLGACWSNFGAVPLNAMPELKSKLGFDDPWKVQTSLCIGYPKFRQSGMVARHHRPVTWFRPQ